MLTVIVIYVLLQYLISLMYYYILCAKSPVLAQSLFWSFSYVLLLLHCSYFVMIVYCLLYACCFMCYFWLLIVFVLCLCSLSLLFCVV